VYVSPSLKMRLSSLGGAYTELQCFFRHVELTPDQETLDVSTTCNPRGQQPGITQWTINIDVQLSFGALADPATAGSWNTLRLLSAQQVDWELVPAAGSITEGNPKASGTAWAPVVPFVNSDVGQPTYFPLAFNVIGTPTFATA